MKTSLIAALVSFLVAGCGGGGAMPTTPGYQAQSLKSVAPPAWTQVTLGTSCEAMLPAACGLPLAVTRDGRYTQTLASGATTQGTLASEDFGQVKAAADAVAGAINGKLSTCETPVPTVPGSGTVVKFEMSDASSRELVAAGMAMPGQCNPPGTQQLADALRAARTHTQPAPAPSA
ncbi:MAG: hypothetical protein ACXU8N_13230 [Telluria sp.]